MKFYVAGATDAIDDVRLIQNLMKGLGHNLTFDWTDPVIGDIRHDWSDHPEEARSHSKKELDAVRESDFVVIVPSPKGRGLGCFVEVGAAMGLEIPVYVVKVVVPMRESVFWYAPNVTRLDSPADLIFAIGAIEVSS